MLNLNKKLKYLPFSPGVYIFKDIFGKILYVGKAGSLKDRVGSYFVGVDLVSARKGQTQGLSLRSMGYGNRPIER